MQLRSKYVLGLISGGAILGSVHAAHGGIFQNISFSEQIEADPIPLPQPNPQYQTFSGSTLPVSQVLSINLNGQTCQATYNFSDNGTAAVLETSSTFTLTGSHEGASEGYTTAVTKFVLEEPCQFGIVFDQSISGVFSEDAGAGIIKASGQTVASYGEASSDDFTLTGVLEANTAYYVQEVFAVDNSDTGDSPTGSGSHSFSLTLTPIPEPSSVLMLFGCATLLIKRPLRRREV